jgi:diadenylate cyclase
MGTPFATFPIGPSDVVDILATAILIYYVLLVIRGTRAVQITLGLLVLVVVLALSNVFHLLVLATLLQYIVLGTAVTLPIVFQPELRRGLETIGRGRLLTLREDELHKLEASMRVLAGAAFVLARSRIGALIAIERSSGLKEFAESGTHLGAALSTELLLTIFTPRAPLHDGAVIVNRDRVEAAGCFLPLSDNVLGELRVGTRHRAAIGLTEQTDAVVVVVSEQSGKITVARAGKLSREIDDETRLRTILLACCRAPRPKGKRAEKHRGLVETLRARLESGALAKRRA